MSNSISVRRSNGGLTTFDAFDKMFAPLFQHSVGFDRLFDTMNQALNETGETGKYPPYDIVQTGPDFYRITLAIAGFANDDIELKLENGLLTITGDKTPDEVPTEVKYLHRGIANRKFVHRFRLTDHIRVDGASLKNGILSIELVRELPEALKPRIIEVTSS